MSILNAIAQGFNPGAGKLAGAQNAYAIKRDEEQERYNRSRDAKADQQNAMTRQDAKDAQAAQWFQGIVGQSAAIKDPGQRVQWIQSMVETSPYETPPPDQMAKLLQAAALQPGPAPELMKGADGTMVPKVEGSRYKPDKPPATPKPTAVKVFGPDGVSPRFVTQAEALEKGLEPWTEKGAERARAKTPDPEATEKALDQFELVRGALEKAKKRSGAAGRSKGRQELEAYTVGSTDFTELQTYADTIKTNMLILASDPNVKKFFGPQMSEADVRMMQAGGTTLDPDKQGPEAFNEELARIEDFINRAETAVRNKGGGDGGWSIVR